jgi:preprotein translocase subunit SecE
VTVCLPGSSNALESGPLAIERDAMSTKTGVVEFFRQVRQEVAKVTWPTRKETMVTTAMVFVMIFVMALFFFVVDQVLNVGVRFVLNLGA